MEDLYIIYSINKSYLIKIHFQKIDKYKWKYQENIFVGKLPTDFTDINISFLFIEEITVKKIKTKQKK